MKSHRAQGGFTLIEIIAVLIILGILSAVAIPKYVDMKDTAANKAAEGAVAAGQSALTMAYAKCILENDGDTTACAEADVVTAVGTNCGVGDQDYTVTCSAATGGGIDITATAKSGSGTATGAWQLPQ